MILGTALLLVVLATSDVSSQATHNYDVQDCRKFKMFAQHAENPDNCRTFYNCDLTFGGKLSYCSDGTTYDYRQGVCTQGAECPRWYQDANCLGNANVGRKFAGICCRTYYSYSCASKTYTVGYCPIGQFFSEGQQGCTTQRPSGCSDCGSGIPDNFCSNTHMIRVSDCTFKKKGSDEVMRCAPGTAFDNVLCTCSHDKEYKCPVPVPVYGCPSRLVFDINTDTFRPISQGPAAPIQFQSKPVPLWYLGGQDVLFTPFALRLRFALNPQNFGNVDILTTSSDCKGLRLEARIQNNFLTVTLQKDQDVLTASGQINPLGANTVLILINAPNEFIVYFNGNRINSANSGQYTPVFNKWNGADPKPLLCQVNVGPFSGVVNEIAFWRQCTDPNALNAQ